ncbi:unnamed protein product [Mucor hiemalis]
MSSQPTHSAPKQTSDIDGDTITKDNVAETGTAKPGCFTGLLHSILTVVQRLITALA